MPFLAFPPEVRKVIYTTNSIESLNYQLRKSAFLMFTARPLPVANPGGRPSRSAATGGRFILGGIDRVGVGDHFGGDPGGLSTNPLRVPVR